MKHKIPFIKPDFPTAEEMAEDYAAIVASNWYTNFGPFEHKLSEAVAAYVGQGVSVATVANATLGLEIAVRALLTKSEDAKNEVIMPSFTFAAGAEVLLSAGYTPVFIDIEDSSWQPSIPQARSYLAQHRTKIRGILLCNIFGVGNEHISEWEDLAAEYRIPLIIDTAAGFGSQYTDSVAVGARGDCEVFSLHATKPFCVGEGGLIVSRDAALIEKCRSLQNFGFVDYVIQSVGTNAKLQEINCAIGCRQLIKLDTNLAKRRRTLCRYKEFLTPYEFDYQDNDEKSTVPFFSVAVRTKEEATAIRTALRDEGVEVRSYYNPLHLNGYLQAHTVNADILSVTESISERILSLPVHDDMSDEIIDKITGIITKAIKSCVVTK